MDLQEQMEKLSDTQKEKIILQYLKVRSKANQKYTQELKDNEEFIKKNREFAKNYYQKNKEIILERAREWNRTNKDARKIITERQKKSKLQTFWEINTEKRED